MVGVSASFCPLIVDSLVGLGDVAGVEQLVDPEVDRLLGSASITKRAKWWLFGMDRDEK